MLSTTASLLPILFFLWRRTSKLYSLLLLRLICWFSTAYLFVYLSQLFPLFFDLLGKWDESCLYVESGLSTRLIELHAEFSSKCRSLLSIDHLFLGHVAFVTDKYLFDVSSPIGVRFELADPMPHRVERVLTRAIIREDNTIRLVKVLHRHCTETFLTSCVPHQKLDILSIDLKILDLKINAHGCDVITSETVIWKSLQQTTLANLGIS